MGINYNPAAITSNLELSLDFANPRNYSYNVVPFPGNIKRWMDVNSGGMNNASFSVDSTQISPVGGISMRMIPTNNDSHTTTYYANKWNLSAANTGETWTASVWVKANTATVIEGPVIFGCYEANGAYVEAGSAGSFAVDTNWKRVSYTRTMTHPNTRTIQIRLDGPETLTTPVTLWWDGLQVEKLPYASNFNSITNTYGNSAIESLSLRNFQFHGDEYWSHTPLNAAVEPERTNYIRNNTMQGAVAGTPGTLPTNWFTFTTLTGLTQSVVGTGVENGVTYIDIRINGTPSGAGTFGVYFEGNTSVAALNGQIWTESVYLKLQAGTLNGVTDARLVFDERTSVAYIRSNFSGPITPTTAALNTQRNSLTATLSGGATVANIVPYINLSLTGAAIDITLRIGMPQLELGSTTTSVISTKTEARTRYPQQEGTITFDRTTSPSLKFGGGARINTTGNLAVKEFLYKNHTWEIWFRINDRNAGIYGEPSIEGTSTLMSYRGYHAGFWYGPTYMAYHIWWGAATTNAVCSWTVGTTGSQINQGSWYQLAVTRDGNVFTPYINGVQLGTGGTFVTSNVGVLTSDQLWLGKTDAVAANTGQYLAYSKNTIGAVRMYTRALTALEIEQNFNSLRGRYGI